MVLCDKKIILAAVAAALVYGCVKFKLGEFTLVQHVVRIAKTEPARELGKGILHKAESAQSELKAQLRTRLASTRKPEGGRQLAANPEP